MPVGRIKPPNNRYSLDEMIPILESNTHVKYFAVSNVETKQDLEEFLQKIPEHIDIVPKIESQKAVLNIDEICNSLKSNK